MALKWRHRNDFAGALYVDLVRALVVAAELYNRERMLPGENKVRLQQHGL